MSKNQNYDERNSDGESDKLFKTKVLSLQYQLTQSCLFSPSLWRPKKWRWDIIVWIVLILTGSNARDENSLRIKQRWYEIIWIGSIHMNRFAIEEDDLRRRESWLSSCTFKFVSISTLLPININLLIWLFHRYFLIKLMFKST